MNLIRIKTLDWTKWNPQDSGVSVETPFGKYTVWTYSEADGKWFWTRRPNYVSPVEASGEAKSQYDAIMQAENDYFALVRSLLVIGG